MPEKTVSMVSLASSMEPHVSSVLVSYILLLIYLKKTFPEKTGNLLKFGTSLV